LEENLPNYPSPANLFLSKREKEEISPQHVKEEALPFEEPLRRFLLEEQVNRRRPSPNSSMHLQRRISLGGASPL